MNSEKLKLLQAQVRVGGKGTPRRKKKIVYRTIAPDDKKIQSSLKKLSANVISGIEEVNMFMEDGSIIHFNTPKVQGSWAANTVAVTGHGEKKQFSELLPGILKQLDRETMTQLLNSATNVDGDDGAAEDDEDDGVPDLVRNFGESSKE